MRERVDPRDPGVSAGKATALLLLRVFLMVLVVVVTALFILRVNQTTGEPIRPGQPAPKPPLIGWSIALPLTVAIVIGGAVILFDVLTPRKKLSMLSGVFLGLLAGILASVALSFLIDLAAQGYELEKHPIIPTAKILLSVTLCYLAVSVVLQTQDDFRLVIPYVEFSKQVRGVRPFALDTSALIDGRVFELAQSGLIHAGLLIPRFVVAELHRLADSADRLKRAKGRRGLDMVTRLQRLQKVAVSIDEGAPDAPGVDEQLVEFARLSAATILTTDSGLARIAEIHGVGVINLNTLASALRPGVLAGEAVVVRIVKPGEQAGQGVGFLDDGTMVVVENGGALIGEEREMTITGSLQTSAGRLVFARVPDAPGTSGVPGSPGTPIAGSPGDIAAAPAPGAGAGPGASLHVGPAALQDGDGAPDPAAGARDSAVGDEPARRGPFAPTRPDPRKGALRNPRRG